MIIELLKDLEKKGIKVMLAEDQLKISAAKGKMTGEVVKILKENREGILAFLKGNTMAKTPSDFTLKNLSVKEYKKLLKEKGLTGYEVEDIYTLSPLQKGMLYHALLDKESESYFEQMTMTLKGEIHGELILESWKEVSLRHEALRTMIVPDYREGIQIVLNNRTPQFLFEKHPGADESFIEEMRVADRKNLFDLEKDPLFRVKVIQTGSDTCYLIISFHHIILDGWCTSILFKEFLEIYTCLSQGKKHTLKKPPVYSRYMKWLEKQSVKESEQFWIEALAGYEESAVLPFEVSDYRGPEVKRESSLLFSIKESEEITALAKSLGVSLNTVIQTLWGLLLFHYNRTRDAVFGITVSGRPQELPGVEEMVGLFINTIPLRVRADEKMSFKELVKEVHRESSKSLSYHHASLAEIQNTTALKNSLLDHIMVFENYPVDKEGNSPLNIVKTEFFEQINYDLGIIVVPGESLQLKFTYNPQKYSDSVINRIQNHFYTGSKEVLENPEKELSEINLIPEEEKKLLNSFNPPRIPLCTEGRTIKELLEKQAAETPEKTALCFEDRKLTYRELHEKANLLACELTQVYGLKPGEKAGILLNRCELQIIALLAVIKTGAAWVPLDPENPLKRTAFITEDSKMSLVITQKEYTNSPGSYSGASLVLEKETLKELSEKYPIGAAPGACPATELTGEDLLYMIYTSGTTGKPKGVGLKNLNMVNLIDHQLKEREWKDSVVLQFAAFSFDVCYQEIFTALASGGTLQLIDNETRKNPDSLFKYCEEKGVNTLYLPTAYLKFLSEETWLKNLPESIGHIITAGEQLQISEDLKKALKEKNITLHNHYGPSETHVVTILTLKPSEPMASIPTIGKPVQNTSVYILSPEGKIQPLGVPGELCIGGYNVGAGYLSNPRLTAEKFKNLPAMEDERVYHTGDLACWLPSGEIEFLGRIDKQVKIRGFRVEPGEIESSLMALDSVAAAAIIVKEGELIAYYVPSENSREEEIRGALKNSLPDYMIPSAFVPLEALPLTTNGKLDAAALPKPGHCRDSNRSVPASTETEKQILTLWKEVLSREDIGVTDNFFDLGGHSLKATSLVSRMKKQFQKVITLKMLFDHGTVRELAMLIEESEKREEETILPIKKEESYGLSHAQKRLWVLSQLEENTTYNLPEALWLKGELNREVLEKSFHYVIHRHESLRTVFITEEGEPRQKVLENPPASLIFEDLREEKNPEKAALSRAEEDMNTPFDLEKGPLVRGTILSLKEKHLLLFNIHHIVTDGWSMNIFMKDFLMAFEAFSRGEEPEAEPLKIHYKEYTAWQSEWLKTPSVEEEKAYWQKQFQSEIPVLNLPSDRNRPAIQTYNGQNHDFTFSASQTEGLLSLCRKEGVSLFMMLQALCKCLFYRYTGQEEIILGSPIAGRVKKELENQIGFYVNTLALKDTLCGEMSFKEFLHSVKETCTMAFAHENYPFDSLVEELDLKRDLSRSPLFDVLLVLQNNERTDFQLEGCEMTPFIRENTTSKFDMSLHFTETEKGLNCFIEYNRDIYFPERIKRLEEHLRALTDSLLKAPESALKDLNILSERDKKELWDFNNTVSDYPGEKTLTELFEEQAEATPESAALQWEDEGNIRSYTYRELNEKAGELASYLQLHEKLMPGDTAALLLDRNEKMVLSLLALLKGGCSFVPLDRSAPAERLVYTLNDSSAELLITTRECFNESLCEYTGKVFFIEDYMNTDPKDSSQIFTLPGTSSDDLLYRIYTSGTTGKPKGVGLYHRNMANLMDFQFKNREVFPGRKTLQFASHAFDVCYQETFTALLSGGTLVLIDDETRKTPLALFHHIEKHSVSLLFLPTAYLKFMASEERGLKALPSCVEHLVVAGEELIISAELAEALKEKNITLHNHYGPSETHVVTTLTLSPHEDPEAVPTIGKPIQNTEIHITDPFMNALPPGIPGELCIAGAAVGGGYAKDAALTEKKFIQADHLTSASPLYRTGDLAFWTDRGEIRFMGRMDSQVKIRGFRVEPKEIETTLLNCREVDAAAVVVREDSRGEKELCAYYTSSKEISKEDLRDSLKKSLPDYMIPGAFIEMKALPLTSNGKLDTGALPLPVETPETKELCMPETETEKTLLQIWKEILKKEALGISDNFFDHGGHSLKGTRMVTRISQLMKKEIKLRDIFDYPTVREMAAHIDRNNFSKKSSFESVPRCEAAENYPLSQGQKRLWVLDQLDEGNRAYHMPGAYTLHGEFCENAFQRAVDYVISRHEILRTTFISEKGVPRQVISETSSCLVKVRDLRELSDKEFQETAEREIREDLNKPFDLEKDSLIRFYLFRERDDKNLLYFNMHHIISDGWSLTVLLKEILFAYEKYVSGETPLEEELRIQYRDFSQWQNALLEKDHFQKQKEYWFEKLAHVPQLNLPSDRIRPAVQTFSGKSVSFTLPKEGINALCREQGVSLFMMVNALIKTLLYRYTGETDIITGSPMAGRAHGDLENQIGLYLNTLAIRDIFSGDMIFTDFLKEVKTSCSEAFENQDYPFNTLVEELDLIRDLSRSPLFDVMVVVQNNEKVDLSTSLLKAEPVLLENNTCKFDFSFDFSESEDSLICIIDYNCDIYSEKRVMALASHLKTLTESVLASPSAPLCELSILPEAEKELIHSFNETEADYPEEFTVVDLFEMRAGKYPERKALTYKDKVFTYGDINAQANKIAAYLKETLSVSEGDLVALSMERSEAMVISILGILKAGAAYVPIDPEYPEERIRYILEDAEPKAFLTRGAVSSREGAGDFKKIFTDINEILHTPTACENPQRKTTRESLAYVIYTSGSTGRPKGTLIPFYGMNNTLWYMEKNYPLTEEDIYLFKTNYTFDVSVTELFAWIYGEGSLAILPPGEEGDPKAIEAFIQKEKITHMNFVPSMFQVFLDTLQGELNGVKYIFVAGEAFTPDLRDKAQKLSSVIIQNIYGPTEASIYVTDYPIAGKNEHSSVPIGKPLGNTEVHILDSCLNPVPVGVPGELCVTGKGVALGYLNKPELTEEKFILTDSGKRMYRTGDLVSWLWDGNIDYHGRIDSQVKVRGYRIELGEIENCLLKMEGIINAVVLVKEKNLAAYYTTSKEINKEDVRAYSGSFLPLYMVPAFFTELEEFPLLPSGKINKKALPDPVFQSETPYEPPRNEEEEKMVSLWKEVLKKDEVGVFDNFFELGGNSLTAAALSSGIHEVFNTEVGLKEIFMSPVLCDLTDTIAGKRAEKEEKLNDILSQFNINV